MSTRSAADRPEPGPLKAVLLAAGMGSRMARELGSPSKLFLPLGGTTVVGASLRALLDAGVFAETVVVVGHAADAVEGAVSAAVAPEEPVVVVRYGGFAKGLSGSIATGVRALSPPASGVAVALGDLPLVRPATVRALARQLLAAGPSAIVRPSYCRIPGHPVLFGAAYCGALSSLAAGDGGARSLLNAGAVTVVDVVDSGVVMDVDTPEAYEAVRTVYGRGR